MRSSGSVAMNSALGTTIVFVCLASGLLVVAMVALARHVSAPSLAPAPSQMQPAKTGGEGYAPQNMGSGSVPYQAIADGAAGQTSTRPRPASSSFSSYAQVGSSAGNRGPVVVAGGGAAIAVQPVEG